VGVPLFDRRARGMALTASGAALLAHARMIEAQCRVADGELEALARGQAGRIRLGAGPYWGNTVVPRAIARLHERLPGVDVGLEVAVNTVIQPKLYAGELDVIVGALPESAGLPAGIERRDICRINLRVVAGRGHPLQRRKRVSVMDLGRYPWVVYQHDRDVMDNLAALLRRGGAAAPEIRVETTSVTAVLQLLRSGPYLACLADAFLRAAPEPEIAILRYPHEIWSFPSGALFHTAVRDFAPIRLLIDLIAREAGVRDSGGRRKR
jgi:DNA-binding transcriptional LysR family regulator